MKSSEDWLPQWGGGESVRPPVIRALSIIAYVAYVDTSKIQAMHRGRNDTLNAAQLLFSVYW